MRLSLLSILFISASNLASAESATHEADGDHGHMSHQSAGITGEVSNAEVINSKRFERLVTVSYTHLTLPTSYAV